MLFCAVVYTSDEEPVPSKVRRTSRDEHDVDDITDDEPVTPKVRRGRRDSRDEHDEQLDGSSTHDEPTQSKVKVRRQMTRNPWSSTDLGILWNNFRHCKKAPNAEAIRAVMAANPSLACRTLPQIKTRAWALIRKKKKRV